MPGRHRKKKRTARKKMRSRRPFKKSLRQFTHPIPSEKVEESEKKYDRKRAKEEYREEISRETADE